jgi:hypothetical protein
VTAPAFDATPLTSEERLFFAAAAAYGSDHRNHHGYATVGSPTEAAADMNTALVELTAAQAGGV